MCFKQDGAISTLNAKSPKLGDQFTYLSSIISSTESNVNRHIRKTSSAIDRLLSIGKSDLSAKIKLHFFQDVAVSVLLYGYITWTLKTVKRKC